MANNVEVKARLRDPARAAAAAEALSGGPPAVLRQVDTFYASARGRLKLREQDDRAELIAYERPDLPGPKTSDYEVVPVAHAGALGHALGRALGVTGRVAKVRRLYLAGRTRIHLDAVDGLGDYLELEVVLRPGEDPADGHREATDLLARLGVDDADRVAVAYVDLLRMSDPGAAP